MLRRISGSRGPVRAAFSLIELMVVIAILAVLMTMVIVGVQRARVVAKRTQTVAEISQLSDAIAAFQQDRRINYIPSRIDINGNDIGSLTFLKQCWPQYTPSGPQTILEGDQCLVFFLGGLNGTTGISKNPSAPFTGGGGGSFFQFPVTRLASLHGNPQFPSFLDPFGTPYIFFSSNGKKNGYSGDCPTVASGFLPYIDSSGSYIQPTGFQIISAGANLSFGTGGLLTPGVFGEDSGDGDNLTNFSPGQLTGYGINN